jgi:hypothetical protein
MAAPDTELSVLEKLNFAGAVLFTGIPILGFPAFNFLC